MDKRLVLLAVLHPTTVHEMKEEELSTFQLSSAHAHTYKYSSLFLESGGKKENLQKRKKKKDSRDLARTASIH